MRIYVLILALWAVYGSAWATESTSATAEAAAVTEPATSEAMATVEPAVTSTVEETAAAPTPETSLPETELTTSPTPSPEAETTSPSETKSTTSPSPTFPTPPETESATTPSPSTIPTAKETESTSTPSETSKTTESTTTPAFPTAITDTLKRIVKVDMDQIAVTPSPLNGLYEVVIGAEVLYISADGRYVVMGDIRDTDTGQNLTDDKRNQLRAKQINALNEKELIVFAPEKETEYTINVFTDVDCPYCAKFHNEVPELNKGGVKVRYLAFPRAGAGSKTHKTMVSVWCAEDPQQAMTDAKAGRKVKETTCNNPVDSQYELGKRIGVTGTPAMVLSNGELVPGYVPAKRLLRFLKKSALPSLLGGKIIRP